LEKDNKAEEEFEKVLKLNYFRDFWLLSYSFTPQFDI